jgi:uncharacterized protein (DUF3820 family)
MESLFVVPFGKFKNQPIEDISDNYLNWLIEQDFFQENHPEGVKAIMQELEYRDKFTRPEEDTDSKWNRR